MNRAYGPTNEAQECRNPGAMMDRALDTMGKTLANLEGAVDTLSSTLTPVLTTPPPSTKDKLVAASPMGLTSRHESVLCFNSRINDLVTKVRDLIERANP